MQAYPTISKRHRIHSQTELSLFPGHSLKCCFDVSFRGFLLNNAKRVGKKERGTQFNYYTLIPQNCTNIRKNDTFISQIAKNNNREYLCR